MIKHIVLDLDHTVICSLEKGAKEAQKIKQYKKLFKYHEMEQYVVFERPHLREFLQALVKKYTISVWTAASYGYGDFIITHIINPYLAPRAKVDLFLFDYNCEISSQTTGILKNLDLLYAMGPYGYTFTRDNTIIVDDNQDITSQNSFVLHIKEFNLDPTDNELLHILQKIQTIQ